MAERPGRFRALLEWCSAIRTRSIMKAFLICLFVFIFVMMVILIIVVVLWRKGDAGCFSAFYRESCEFGKKYYDKALIPFSTARVFAEVEDALSSDSPVVVGSEHDVVANTKQFFSACLFADKHESQNVMALRSYVSSLGGWPLALGTRWTGDMAKALYTLGQVWREFGSNGLFHIVVSRSLTGVGPLLMLGVEDLDVFSTVGLDGHFPFLPLKLRLRSLEESNFVQILVNVAKIIYGKEVDHYQATREAKGVASFIIRHQQLTDLSGERQISQMRIEKLSSYLGRDWLPVFSQVLNGTGRTASATDVVLVYDVRNTVKELSRTMERAGARTVVNVVMWHVVFNLLWHTNARLRRSYDQLRALSRLSPEFRVKKCIKVLTEFYPYAVARCHADKYFVEEDVSQIFRLVKNVQEAYVNVLSSSKWLSTSSKKNLEQKVKATSLEYVYPKWINDDTLLSKYHAKMKVGFDHFQNVLDGHKFKSLLVLDQFISGFSVKTWPFAPLAVNAMYLPLKNEIIIYGGLVRSLNVHGNLSFDDV